LSSANFAFTQYYSAATCLVVEPSQSFVSAIKNCLISLDLAGVRVVGTSIYKDAISFVESHKPLILICEHQVEEQLGFGIVEHHRKTVESDFRVSIMVSRNATDSVVAEAAEGDVDSFLLKPFSTKDLVERLTQIFHRKAFPTPYELELRKAQMCRKDGRDEMALDFLRGAKKLSETPSLACFFSGEILEAKGERDKALAEYREGRKGNPIHYRCLFGEFQVLIDSKRYQEANTLIPVLIKNFPLTPARLRQMFIASVFSYQFEYLPIYYEQFVRLERRPPELVKVASMAFYAAGRSLLGQKKSKEAASFFDKAIVIVGRHFEMIEKIVQDLLKVSEVSIAQNVLAKTLADDQFSVTYERLAFRIDLQTLQPQQILDRGRKFIQEGKGTPEIALVLVKLAAKEGKSTLAETFIQRVLMDHPEARPELYQALESSKKS